MESSSVHPIEGAIYDGEGNMVYPRPEPPRVKESIQVSIPLAGTTLGDLLGGTAHEMRVEQKLDKIISLLEKDKDNGEEEDSKGFRSSNKN